MSNTKENTAAEVKHTPGPWKANEGKAPRTRCGSFGREVVGNRYEDSEGVTYTVVAQVEGNQTSQLTTEANARLIAAAPDLLEALILVVAIADRQTVEFDKARAAIAEAKST